MKYVAGRVAGERKRVRGNEGADVGVEGASGSPTESYSKGKVRCVSAQSGGRWDTREESACLAATSSGPSESCTRAAGGRGRGSSESVALS